MLFWCDVIESETTIFWRFSDFRWITLIQLLIVTSSHFLVTSLKAFETIEETIEINCHTNSQVIIRIYICTLQRKRQIYLVWEMAISDRFYYEYSLRCLSVHKFFFRRSEKYLEVFIANQPIKNKIYGIFLKSILEFNLIYLESCYKWQYQNKLQKSLCDSWSRCVLLATSRV